MSDSADNNDVGMYLRAEATYTDRRGANKTADFVSPHRVRPAKVEANSYPEFNPTSHTRRVQEGESGMTVGAPVTATDADGDVINYTLDGEIFMVDGENAFAIDQATGQITTAADLNFEAGTTSFTIMVRATDSAGFNTDTDAGGDVPDDAEVTITLLNVNEAPDFGGENRTPGSEANIRGMAPDKNEEGVGAANAWNAVVSDYTATDQEGVVIDGNKWSLSGDDAGMFELNDPDPAEADTKVLAFKEKADFEMPGDRDQNNIYEVTVVASDGSESSELDVTVKNPGPG